MTLPNDELVFGYWPARQLRGDIPPAIREPSKYIGGDILNIACTQTSLTKSRQQKLVNEWCNLLPTLQIKTLVFSSKVSQQLFEAACNIPHLEALSIKWSSIVSFEPISKLTCLQSLFLGSSPGIKSLKPLSKCAALKHLFIQNTQEPVDLSFVENLQLLLEFGLSASRGRKLKVITLRPLSALEKLELLWLVDLQIIEGGMKPLYSLRNLASLRTTMNSSSLEFRKLCSAVPTLKHFQPVG